LEELKKKQAWAWKEEGYGNIGVEEQKSRDRNVL
jgi:hypothetical protein